MLSLDLLLPSNFIPSQYHLPLITDFRHATIQPPVFFSEPTNPALNGYTDWTLPHLVVVPMLSHHVLHILDQVTGQRLGVLHR